jgi:hypothetical protein
MANCYSEMLESALRKKLPFPASGIAPKIPLSSLIRNEDGMKKKTAAKWQPPQYRFSPAAQNSSFRRTKLRARMANSRL